MSRSTPLVILYAEDDQDDVFLFKQGLRPAHVNASVESVPNGQTAIDYLEGKGDYQDRSAHPFPDLIFVDWRMPAKNGAEFLKWCRESPHCESLTVLVITGSNSPRDSEKALEPGANMVLMKVASPEQMSRQLAEICHAEMNKSAERQK